MKLQSLLFTTLNRSFVSHHPLVPTPLLSEMKKRTRNLGMDNIAALSLNSIPTTPTPDQLAFKRITRKRSVRPSNALKIKRVLIDDLQKEHISSYTANTTCSTGFPSLSHSPANSGNITISKVDDDCCWRRLNVDMKELCLDLTFPTGQTFRWKQTGPSEYTGVVGTDLVTLRQIGDEVEYFIHAQHQEAEAEAEAKTETALRDYLNTGISLVDMWKGFAEADSRFAALAPHMAGARLLRQDPLECLFQFICSSNNHIQRITQMVGCLSSFGPYLGSVEGTDFHAFPSLEDLSAVREEQLRKAGFGYRAKYIVGAVEALKSKHGGGQRWLLSLRKLPLEDSMEALCTLPGVGAKVASCIALFSLDQHHAIPVDTHVWQIATRYITPELSKERLTPKLSQKVSEAFVKKFGKYAGWAQTVLFIAELSSQQTALPQHLRTIKEPKIRTKHKKCAIKDMDD
uniref:DNA-(apurinic or apyrimidinic site) lyase n=1 Tax=Wollemia nobilis TaxID=56998 RepID=A0A0C9S6A3_9CONI